MDVSQFRPIHVCSFIAFAFCFHIRIRIRVCLIDPNTHRHLEKTEANKAANKVIIQNIS
ncbi:hypothetical protein Hanom_Chr04g00351751 [Helianthus anomalus]